MYAPVLLPQAPAPSPDVLVAERRLLDAEGAYHVEGRYYANPIDAARTRRVVAERLVGEATRREQWGRYATAVAPAPLPRVVTWLAPRERGQVDAAGDGHLTCVHRDGLAQLGCDLAAGRADAVLVSAALVRAHDLRLLAGLVRGFPGVVVAGLIAEADGVPALAAAHLLGQAGVAVLIDARPAAGAAGWAALRGTFAPRHLPDAFLRACLAGILADVRGEGNGADVSDGLVRFFAAAFAPNVTRAQQVAARLGVPPSTLASRFYRAALPSPKQYVAWARLVWAARLGESPALSVSLIAHRLDASSPQSFSRTVRTLTGLTAAEFRRRHTGAGMLDRFRALLVRPYRDTLCTFNPLHVIPAPVAARVRVPLIAGRAA